MLIHTDITLCEPAPRMYFENGQIAVTDGLSVWLVIVTCEAMMATARPPEKSLKRLLRYAYFYRELAAAAIQRGEDIDGTVWVRESDVLAAKRSTVSQRARLALKPFQETNSVGTRVSAQQQ